jgi:hypothetical protein
VIEDHAAAAGRTLVKRKDIVRHGNGLKDRR